VNQEPISNRTVRPLADQAGVEQRQPAFDRALPQDSATPSAPRAPSRLIPDPRDYLPTPEYIPPPIDEPTLRQECRRIFLDRTDRNIDDILRMILDRPEPGTVDDRKSRIGCSFRQFYWGLRKMFQVSPKGFWAHHCDLFDQYGRRKTSHEELRRISKLKTVHSVKSIVKEFKRAGLIETFPLKRNQDGKIVDWRVRFRADLVNEAAEVIYDCKRLGIKRPAARNTPAKDVQKISPQDVKTDHSDAGKTSGSGDSLGTTTTVVVNSLAFPIVQDDDVADSFDLDAFVPSGLIGESEKKQNMAATRHVSFNENLGGPSETAVPTPGEGIGTNPIPHDSNPGEPCPAKDPILPPGAMEHPGETGHNSLSQMSLALDERTQATGGTDFDFRFSEETKKVIAILREVYPEIDQAPHSILMKLQGWVRNPTPRYKLDEEKARDFVRCKVNSDVFPKFWVLSLETFVQRWPWCATAMRDWDFLSEEIEVDVVVDIINRPARMLKCPSWVEPPHNNRPEYWFSRLMFGIARRWRMEELKEIGAKAQVYLRSEPLLYLGGCNAVPEFPSIIGFAPAIGAQVTEEAEKMLRQAQVWRKLRQLHHEPPGYKYRTGEDD
jgi:hypothetical protein